MVTPAPRRREGYGKIDARWDERILSIRTVRREENDPIQRGGLAAAHITR